MKLSRIQVSNALYPSIRLDPQTAAKARRIRRLVVGANVLLYCGSKISFQTTEVANMTALRASCGTPLLAPQGRAYKPCRALRWHVVLEPLAPNLNKAMTDTTPVHVPETSGALVITEVCHWRRVLVRGFD